ncbi:MAG: GTP cyclohydrolase I FolE [Acidobacteria bacterium]|nr:GTP cyclohydrolase I FolE [Acidobacteriota bacterium]
MEKLIESMLEELGEDPQRQGLRKTPARVAETFKFLTKGYSENVEEILKDALFDVQYDEMVIIRNIEVYSLCEHHLLPFFGKCHVGYLPTRKVIGLSKVIRLVELFARRLQVQERLTQQIAHTIQEQANPQGVGVIIEAQHLCMMMRGVEKQNVKVTTSTLLGKFRQDQRSRMEFLNLVRINNP